MIKRSLLLSLLLTAGGAAFAAHGLVQIGRSMADKRSAAAEDKGDPS